MESKQSDVREVRQLSGFTVWRTMGIALLVCASDHFATSQAERSDQMANALRQNVVRIEAAMSTHVENGFGFVVGERAGQLYIVTAYHVVNDPDAIGVANSVKVKVEFFDRRGKMYNAELLGTHYDKPRELAVLTVPNPAGFTWTKKCLAGSDKQKRGVPVWSIGRAQDWKPPVEPGHVASDPSPDWMLDLEGTVVQPGSSGGPVVSDTGIIGMVEEDSAGNTRALSIDFIKRAFETWNHPWGLQLVGTLPILPPHSDADEITKVLQSYADSYNRRDANALWRIWPSPPPNTKHSIEIAFQTAAAIKMTVDPGTPEIAVDSASVQGQFSQLFTPRNGSPQLRSGDIKFSLKKNNGAWIIVDVK